MDALTLTQLLASALGGLVAVLGAALLWTQQRRAGERRDEQDRERTIAELAAQLRQAARHLRRLKALEAIVELLTR